MDERDTFFEQLQRPRDERRAMGKQLRKEVPRSSHGTWAPAADRTDPLELLQAQDEGRVKELLPIKYGRMVASPFAFLRGSAVVMASDLASTPATGQLVILCATRIFLTSVFSLRRNASLFLMSMILTNVLRDPGNGM